jgi:precorrin-3B synthase
VPDRAEPDVCPGVFAPHAAADGALARIRLPGGGITAAQLRTVALLAESFGDGNVHLTSRGNLQVRGLGPDRAPVVADPAPSQGLPSGRLLAQRVRSRVTVAGPRRTRTGFPLTRPRGGDHQPKAR